MPPDWLSKTMNLKLWGPRQVPVATKSDGDGSVGGRSVAGLASAHEEGQPTELDGNQTLNVILCGEMGVGKSALVNLIARREVARVSSNVHRCTMETNRYDITLDDVNCNIFDTAGLGESAGGSNDYLAALEKAYELVIELGNVGGVHLLLFVMRATRIKGATLNNYRLFVEVVCQARVPVALVFTGLENEEEMDDWWARNKTAIEKYGIKSDGQACITTVQDKPQKYMESQTKIHELLKSFCSKNKAFAPDPHSWFAHLGKEMQPFVKTDRNSRKDVIKVLMKRCKLAEEIAKKLADMMEQAVEVQSSSQRR